MIDYLEDRPVLAAALAVALFLAMVADYVRKKRKGTWVPLRRRPVPYGPVGRYAAVTVMALSSLLGAYMTVDALRAGRVGSVIVGLYLALFAGWVTWVGLVTGRDVTSEEQRETRWRRPWSAWWFVAQGVTIVGLGLVLVVIGVVQGSPWASVGGLVMVALGILFAWATSRMRVQDTLET